MFHVGIVLTFAVEMKCLEGWQFVVDHRGRSELLTLMLRLMMYCRLAVGKGSRLQPLLILRYVEFRQCILLIEEIVYTVEGC